MFEFRHSFAKCLKFRQNLGLIKRLEEDVHVGVTAAERVVNRFRLGAVGDPHPRKSPG